MTHSERVRGWESASEPELKKLYDTTLFWLYLHGEYGIEPASRIHGLHDGLPITDDQPFRRFTLGEDKVRAISPNSAEVLGLQEGNLEMRHWEPCFSYVADGELEYADASCLFVIPQAESSHLSVRYLTVFINNSGKAQSLRMDEPKQRLKPGSEVSGIDTLADLIAAWQLESNTGTDKITSAECQALQEILNNLVVPSPGNRTEPAA